MVDSGSNTIHVKITRSNRPCLQIPPWSTNEIISLEINASKTPADLSQNFLIPTILPHFHHWIKLYGKNFLTWHGPRAYFVVTELDLIKEILVTDKHGTFLKEEPIDYAKKLFGDGTVTSNGEKWSKMRKLANHAFHSESLKGMIPAMIASTEIMLQKWQYNNDKEIEVFEEVKVLTSEIISRTAFGSSYVEGRHIFDMLVQLIVVMFKNKHNVTIPGIGNLLKTSDDIETDKLEHEIHRRFINLIKKREDEAITGQVDGFGTDFLGLLLKSHHDDGISKKITVNELIDECKTFYVAGHETTSSLLTWILLLLAIHPDWQEKARQEVLQVFGHQRPCSLGLTKLKIVSMIINETLRLYPPVVNIRRDTSRQVKIGKLILPANIVIEIPVLVIHHNPEIWGQDFHQFKPERFAEGVAKATNNNVAAYLPFALGPRNCVGSNFAITETKIALSMILQSHNFSL